MTISTFLIISQWQLCYHSNQSSHQIDSKKQNYSFPLPVNAICEIWGEMASQIQSKSHLKNVEGQQTDRWITDT